MGLIFSRRLRIFIIGVLLGLLAGLWVGYNLGQGKPLFSNPFTRETIQDKIKKSGDQAMEKSGRIIEESGRALRNAVNGDEGQ